MRAWLEIDLGAIAHNTRLVRAHVGSNTRVCAVVKADAYGHGIEPVAQVLDQEGIDHFAVISLDEAMRVRSVSGLDVLIMGYLDDQEIEEAVRQGFVLSLFDRDLVDVYVAASQKVGKRARCQLKAETGLNRLGIFADQAIEILANLNRFPELSVESIYTHLAMSGDRDEDIRQMGAFQPVIEAAQAMGLRLPLHMANSHALRVYPEGFLDWVRVGLALYGVDTVVDGLRPSLQAKTVVIQKKPLKKGEGTSYNKLFRAPHDMEIAVVAMGYAEGLSQGLTGKAHVLVHGVRRPIIGQICMNLCVIDTTGLPVKRGDEVVIIGRQGDEEIRVADMAIQAGIRHHEIVIRMGRGLPHVYHGAEWTAPLSTSSTIRAE